MILKCQSTDDDCGDYKEGGHGKGCIKYQESYIKYHDKGVEL